MKKTSLWILGVVILLFISLGAFWTGIVVGYAKYRTAETPEKDSNLPDLSLLTEVWRLVKEKHLDPVGTTTEPIDDRKLVWAAIDGLVGSLDDPYSDFFPPSEKHFFEEEINGAFGGIGVEIGSRDGVLQVIAPLPESPARRAGIVSGDKIVGVDGRSTREMSIPEAIQLIRGEVGTPVDLEIHRGEKSLRFTVVRSRIEVPTLETNLLPGGIFVIRLFNFGATAPELFRGALREFVESDSHKMILDLRDNPGGFLAAAVEISSWFLPPGAPVVIEERGNGGLGERIHRSRGYNIFGDDFRLVVLINGGSASASEIVAAALSEYGQATLVGEKTFGKGSVQELIDLGDDLALKLTTARWLTPKTRRLFSQNGLAPDFVVEVADAVNPENEMKSHISVDRQLQKAIELLL